MDNWGTWLLILGLGNPHLYAKKYKDIVNMQSRNNICIHEHSKPYNQTRTLTPNMSKIENRLLLKCAKRCQDRIISTCANKWWVFHGDRGHYANCMLHVKHNAIFTNTFFLHYMGWLVILLHAMHTRGCLCYSYNPDLLHVLHISINLKVVPQWEIKFKLSSLDSTSKNWRIILHLPIKKPKS